MAEQTSLVAQQVRLMHWARTDQRMSEPSGRYGCIDLV